MMSTINRRELLLSIPAVALAPRLLGQAAKPVIALKGLSSFVLAVSDMKRSIDFYQGLFGMPIQARQGQNVLLRIGKGPQFLMLTPAGSNPPALVPRLGLKVDNFNPDRIISMLEQHGVSRAAAGDPGLTGGAMKVRVSRRGPENGGATDGTPELFLGDPDDFVLQIHDVSYAGGAGGLGNVVKVEESPKKGLIALSDMPLHDQRVGCQPDPDVLSGSFRHSSAVATSHNAWPGYRSRGHVPDVHRRRRRTWPWTRWSPRRRCCRRCRRSCTCSCTRAGPARQRQSRQREYGKLQAR
jgi:catechol 2,3-dioxygenase-like lactoylglutathione lyase family enzyme